MGHRELIGIRYTDFLVNEILPDGTVVHLEDSSDHGLKSSSKRVESHQAKARQPPDESTTEADRVTDDTKTPLPLAAADGAPIGNKSPKPLTNIRENVNSSGKRTMGSSPPMSPPKMAKVENVKLQKEQVRLHYTSNGIEIIDGPAPEHEPEELDPPPRPPEPVSSTVSTWQNYAQTASPDQVPAAKTDETMGILHKSPGRLPTASKPATKYQPQSLQTLAELISSEAVQSIQDLHQRVLTSPHRKPRDLGKVNCGILDRADRTKVHQALRDAFSSRLESSTDDDGNLVVSAANPQGRGRGGYSTHTGTDGKGQQRTNHREPNTSQMTGKRLWEELGGDYLHFSLLKENKDTMEVISYLARSLHTKPSSFQFAGTKDRRGVTVQRVSVYRQKAERLKALNRGLRSAALGNFTYSPNQLQLGELSGNDFIITLRDCHFPGLSASDSSCVSINEISRMVETAVASMKTQGFLNYYGMQRFGSFETRTDSVGLYMLNGNFKGAVDAILAYPEALLAAGSDDENVNKISRDDRSRAEAIQDFRNGAMTRSVLDTLPRKFSAEAAIIKFLGNAKHSGDYLGAIMSIHRNARLMYLHAYQSLVWNMVASERWKRWGSTVKTGDLVLVKEHQEKVEDEVQAAAIDDDGDIVVQVDENDKSTAFEDTITRARTLSEEEVKSGRYTVFDIVLPTPGFDILYPDNDIGEYYSTFMASERGGGLDPHDMRRRWTDMSLTGSYRKLLVRLTSKMTAEVKQYSEENEKFVDTELDRLRKFNELDNARKTDGPPKRGVENTNSDKMTGERESNGGSVLDQNKGSSDEWTTTHNLGSGIAEIGDKVLDEISSTPEESKIAIIIRMQLQGGQYATMALREMMQGGVTMYKPDFSGGR